MITLAKTAVPLHTMKDGEIEVMVNTWSEEGERCLASNDLIGYEQAYGFVTTYLTEYNRRR